MSFSFDSHSYQFPSVRKMVYGKKGMVCASQNLAAQAGLEALKKGGNAIDAALATAICLTVVEPTSNGIGGDAFAIVYTKEGLAGINGSGTAPKLASKQNILARGYNEMPSRGWIPITVPGAPATWVALSKRFGRLPFESLFESAIIYANEGYPVSPTVSQLWKEYVSDFKKETEMQELLASFFDTFTINGRAPESGELWRSAEHGKTLEALAKTNCQDFYTGNISRAIDSFSRQYDGFLRYEDLAGYSPDWVNPISTNYKGVDVWELPPNGHGIVALMALNILEGFEQSHEWASGTHFHRQLESMKLAFADGKEFIADKLYMKTSVEQLLDKTYAAKRRALINEMALQPAFGNPNSGGTVYLCTADQEGNMVSYIQSNYQGFGSGIVVPKTGIALHNRGANFSMVEGAANCIAPGKKPYHTIIPGFLTKDSKPLGPFGVMGAFMQPQGHLQVVSHLVDFNRNPQEALDAPRWQWIGEKKIAVERSFPYAATEELLRRGHEVTVAADSIDFGRGQMILRGENGVLAGATEPRADGVVAAW